MKIKHQLLLASSLIVVSLPTHADLSYSFVRVDYNIETVDLDNVTEDLEGDGISLEAGLDIANSFAVIAGYANSSGDVSGNGNTVELDVDGYYVGGLFHFAVSESTDMFVGGRYIDLSGDTSLNGTLVSTDDIDGFGLFVGVRGMATEQLELRGMIDRTDLENQSGSSDTDTDISIEAGYYLSPKLSLNAGYTFDSDARTISFGIAKYF